MPTTESDGTPPSGHACVIRQTFAAGIGRCSCGQWWAAMTAQALIRSELRERLDEYRRQINDRRARDLRDAVKQATVRDRARRAREHPKARWKWHSYQAGKAVKYWRIIRLIIIADPCVYCGAEASAVDHIVPRIRGGSDKRSNLAPACNPCNAAKGGRTPEEWKAARLARGLSWPPTRAEAAA